MTDLIVNISWEYFLGILGSLIALAYYANGRFTRLETNFQWLADAVRNLTIKAENVSTKLFDPGSPISLTPAGNRFLEESGLKSYVDDHKEALASALKVNASFDLYAVQEQSFRLMASHHHRPRRLGRILIPPNADFTDFEDRENLRIRRARRIRRRDFGKPCRRAGAWVSRRDARGRLKSSYFSGDT